MSNALRVTVVQNSGDVPLDLLTRALADTDLVLVRPDQGEALPSLDDVDALVVLGGMASVYDDEATPWLPSVRDYLRSAVERGITTLGLCLGAQLLAVALGGEVELAAPGGPERGIIELRMRPDAADDPLLGPVVEALGRTVLAPSSHRDAISVLPEGAIWLASSRQYPFQAFRHGSGWGLQFHVEASEDTLAAWEATDGGDVDALRDDYRAVADQLDQLAGLVGTTFVALAAEHVSG